MAQILVVCTANICRSPVAKGMLRYKLNQGGLVDWKVESAGTWATPGQEASPFSVQVAAEYGLDIADHRSQIITDALLRDSDLILCMAAGHVEALKVEFGKHAHKVYLLSEMIGKSYDIDDPIGGPIEEYRVMGRELNSIISSGIGRIVGLAAGTKAGRFNE